MSVREAAQLLGISSDGVRMRIKRGSMESERDEEGHIWVWADTPSQEPNSSGEHNSVEVESLREQVTYLRSVIDQRDEELQRAHQLLGESLSQLRALNAPAREAPQDIEESQPSEESLQREESSDEARTPTEDTGEPQTASQRPWWKRIFGG